VRQTKLASSLVNFRAHHKIAGLYSDFLLQTGPGTAAEVFPPRRRSDGDQLANIGGGQRQRNAVDDPTAWTSWGTSRTAISSSASAAQRCLSRWQEHHPDHRHCVLLRQYPLHFHIPIVVVVGVIIFVESAD